MQESGNHIHLHNTYCAFFVFRCLCTKAPQRPTQTQYLYLSGKNRTSFVCGTSEGWIVMEETCGPIVAVKRKSESILCPSVPTTITTPPSSNPVEKSRTESQEHTAGSQTPQTDSPALL